MGQGDGAFMVPVGAMGRLRDIVEFAGPSAPLCIFADKCHLPTNSGHLLPGDGITVREGKGRGAGQGAQRSEEEEEEEEDERERGGGTERERESVCVCVCVREREREVERWCITKRPN